MAADLGRHASEAQHDWSDQVLLQLLLLLLLLQTVALDMLFLV